MRQLDHSAHGGLGASVGTPEIGRDHGRHGHCRRAALWRPWNSDMAAAMDGGCRAGTRRFQAGHSYGSVGTGAAPASRRAAAPGHGRPGGCGGARARFWYANRSERIEKTCSTSYSVWFARISLSRKRIPAGGVTDYAHLRPLDQAELWSRSPRAQGGFRPYALRQ